MTNSYVLLSDFIKDFLINYDINGPVPFQPPKCEDLIGRTNEPTQNTLWSSDGIVVGPGQAANQSLISALVRSDPSRGYRYSYSPYYNKLPTVVDDMNNFTQYIHDHAVNVTSGGIFVDNVTAPLLALSASGYDQVAVTNAFNMMRLNITTKMLVGDLRSISSYEMCKFSLLSDMIHITSRSFFSANVK